MTPREVGHICEKYAAKYLEKNGLEILGMNFYCHEGEIDIIAREAEYTVFVEVKARSVTTFGDPCEAVTLKKQKKIIMAAQKYIMENEIETAIRFDVVEIIYRACGNEIKTVKINHIPDAFEL